jgi:hypothetical protein
MWLTEVCHDVVFEAGTRWRQRPGQIDDIATAAKVAIILNVE